MINISSFCLFVSQNYVIFFFLLLVLNLVFLDGGTKNLRQKRKTFYNHDRCHHDTLYKKRKLFDQSSVVMSDGGFSSESVSNSPEKAMNGEESDLTGMLHGGQFLHHCIVIGSLEKKFVVFSNFAKWLYICAATGVSSSVIGRQTSFHSLDSHGTFSVV